MANLRKMILTKDSHRRFVPTQSDCKPVKWDKYFDEEVDVQVGTETFHVYKRGSIGPVLLLLHGGGYNSLTWCLFVEEICRKIECQVVAIDLRGHGTTKTNNEELSLEHLGQDVVHVVEGLWGEDLPVIILIGHSMGGAVAVETAPLIPTVKGVTVIDVVEGTALDALASMQSVLRGRPSSFKSIEQAIFWCFKGGQTNNVDAARVSMPGQIKNKDTGVLAANDPELFKEPDTSHEEQPVFPPEDFRDSIPEEQELDDGASMPVAHKPPLPNSSKNGVVNSFETPPKPSSSYVWKIDLSKTEKYWSGWFQGLSQKFLNIDAPKVLLLASIQGLDTTLTIGQMQGKFQMQVLPKCGHAIHEDQPSQVADVIAGFIVKQRLATPKEGFVPTLPAC